MNKSPRHITNLDDLAALGDAFLIDQFGTIHDGHAAYPGAIATLRHLRERGKKVILLSNSGRRATTGERRLADMGITNACFDASLCSGEVAWQILRRKAPHYLQRHCRVLLFARGNELDILAGFEIERVEQAVEADLVMIAGSETERYGFDALWQLMAPAIARGIPAICTNPDQVMMVRGQLYPGAGALAKAYQAAGGAVQWFGKPYQDIYDAALALLPGIAKSRIVGIGDSLEHDIVGITQAGGAGILVRTGILADLNETALAAEISHLPQPPIALMPRLGF